MQKIRRMIIALLIAALAMGSALATDDWSGFQSDFSGDGAAQVDMLSSGINTDADLVMGYVAQTDESINPFRCTSRDIVSINQLVYESVVELDDSGQPQPLLSDSWKHEGEVWTFHMRSGVVFHNGAELTAYDVVESYNRILAAGESNAYFNRLSLIASVESQDSSTLIVTGRYTGYITLYALTFPVVQASTMDDAMPRGTGPYWITECVTNAGVRLERNPLWWKNDPKIESIACVQCFDTGDALEALHTGDIELFASQSSTAAQSRKISKFTSLDFQTNSFEMLIPNLGDSSVMSDVRVRRAVMYAIDRATLASNAYLGMGVQCEVPINPSSWLYESQSAIYYYSPERALALLQECGWEDLTGDGMLNQVDGVLLRDLTVNLITYNDSYTTIHTTAANMIAANLEKVGINVNVEVLSLSRMQNRIKERSFDLALVGVNLSEVPNLTPLLYSEGSLNLNGYNNEDMYNLLGQSATVQTPEELKSVLSEIQMTVVDRLPIMGLLFRTGTLLATRSLAGLSGNRTGNTLNGIEYLEK